MLRLKNTIEKKIGYIIFKTSKSEIDYIKSLILKSTATFNGNEPTPA